MEYTEENYTFAKSSDTFDFVCQQCGKPIVMTKREISKNRGVVKKYCSYECAHAAHNMGDIEVTCAECGKKKTMKMSEYRKSKSLLFFCDNSCSASYFNKLSPKIKMSDKRICPICGGIKTSHGEMCKKCRKEDNEKRFGDTLIGKYVGFDKKKKYLTSKCGDIRKNARNVLIKEQPTCECAVCHNEEFNSITEVHHIKPITEFSPDTPISVVNDKNNLVWLCPNHHRLVHLGIIKL